MTAAIPSRLDRYLQHRQRWETGAWVLFFAIQAALNSVAVVMDFSREVINVAPWQPVVWEFSSNLALLALMPLLLAFDRRWPLADGSRWRHHLLLHFAATVPYSLLHVLMMVALRHLAYAAAGTTYDFGDWPSELVYEYLKDVRAYFFFHALLQAYRFTILRLQGEASLLAAPDEGTPVEPIDRPERFLVRKLGKEFLVAAVDIEWLQAEGNYVNLHVKGRLYPLRSTMAALEPRLDPARFIRVHRSYMINLEHLAEIEPLDTGDARLTLRDGTAVPCSRRYRAELRARGGREIGASA